MLTCLSSSCTSIDDVCDSIRSILTEAAIPMHLKSKVHLLSSKPDIVYRVDEW